MSDLIELKNKDNLSITITYDTIRSKRKTFSISLQENGSLCVRIPSYVPNYEVRRVLKEKQFWITEKLEEQEKRQLQKPVNNYSETQRLALEKRYIEAAKDYIPKRISYYADCYPTLIPPIYSRISIRNQKTRWGSCSSKGTLSFNWRLMLAPPGILDYVIVHELCHLKQMNHSKDFWESVGCILPDYKERKNWLKNHGHELTLS